MNDLSTFFKIDKTLFYSEQTSYQNTSFIIIF